MTRPVQPAYDARLARTVAVLLGFLALLGVAALNDAAVTITMANAPPAWRRLGTAISTLGLSGYMLVLSAVLVLIGAMAQDRGWRHVFGTSPRLVTERAAFFFTVIAGSGLICQAVKHVLGRARPKLLEQFGAFHFNAFDWAVSQDSFPSGHSTTVFAVAVVFSLFLPAGRLLFFAFATLVAVSRILAGAHFMSDILAGAALGSIVALWFARVFAARNIAFVAAGLPALLVKRDAWWRPRRPGSGGS